MSNCTGCTVLLYLHRDTPLLRCGVERHILSLSLSLAPPDVDDAVNLFASPLYPLETVHLSPGTVSSVATLWKSSQFLEKPTRFQDCDRYDQPTLEQTVRFPGMLKINGTSMELVDKERDISIKIFLKQSVLYKITIVNCSKNINLKY